MENGISYKNYYSKVETLEKGQEHKKWEDVCVRPKMEIVYSSITPKKNSSNLEGCNPYLKK